MEEITTSILALNYKLIGKVSAKLFMEKVISEKEAIYFLGRLCGYPRCCIRAFRKVDGILAVAYARYKEACGKEDPYKLEVEEDDEGWTWIFGYITHIPCSPECLRTKLIFLRHEALCKADCENRVCERFL